SDHGRRDRRARRRRPPPGRLQDEAQPGTGRAAQPAHRGTRAQRRDGRRGGREAGCESSVESAREPDPARGRNGPDLGDPAPASAGPAEADRVVDAESLLSDGLVPAWRPGFGPLPAKTAREFVTANEARVLISRLFTRPEDGQLVGMEARGREFTGRLRQMLVFRDDVCRTPWCDAPIRHADHAEPHAGGGPTEWNNGSGLCAACNFAKEHPGWAHEATAEGLKVTTPSGRTYTVTTPALVRRMRYPRPECGPDAAES